MRGGGTVCQRNDKMSEAYRTMIAEIQPCKKSSMIISVLFLEDKIRYS